MSALLIACLGLNFALEWASNLTTLLFLHRIDLGFWDLIPPANGIAASISLFIFLGLC